MSDQLLTRHQDIYDHVPDIAGVRVALYFPNQVQDVVNALREIFQEVQEIAHPKNDGSPSDRSDDAVSKRTERGYHEMFCGYTATHLRVRLKEAPADLKRDWAYFDNHLVEIQITSVVLHAWSEIEHDMIYKNQSLQAVSGQERAILDAINGLMRTATIMLNQLHISYKIRLELSQRQFRDFWELGKYFRDHTTEVHLQGLDGAERCLLMLSKFLQVIKRDTPGDLDSVLRPLDLDFPCASTWTRFNDIVQEYSPFEPSVCMRSTFAIMTYMLQHLPRKNEVSLRKRFLRDGIDYCLKSRILLSSMLWLCDLCYECEDPHSRYDAHALCGEARMDKTFWSSDAFKWLFDGAYRCDILSRKKEPDTDEKGSLDTVWKWFEAQEAAMISDETRDDLDDRPRSIFGFLHRISKLGMIRQLPENLSLLKYPSFGTPDESNMDEDLEDTRGFDDNQPCLSGFLCVPSRRQAINDLVKDEETASELIKVFLSIHGLGSCTWASCQRSSSVTTPNHPPACGETVLV